MLRTIAALLLFTFSINSFATTRSEVLEKIEVKQERISELREELRNAQRIETVHGPFYPIPNILRFFAGLGLTASFLATAAGGTGLYLMYKPHLQRLLGVSLKGFENYPVFGLIGGVTGITTLTVPYFFLSSMSQDTVTVSEIDEDERQELEEELDQALMDLATFRAELLFEDRAEKNSPTPL